MSSDSRGVDDLPPHKDAGRSTVVLLLGDIASTTWRMFVPTVGMMWIGFLADKSQGTWPWMFVVGIVVGSIVAGLLIKQQLTKKI
ncbi:hypothetical protein H6796_00165 [Candidatus Nomurabacteria bacterium]|nr:hypothetical protein [Candidatus Nomurabacteria bacterium]